MSENNFYAAPQSKPAKIPIAKQLLEQQSTLGLIVGTFSAAIPCLLMHMIFMASNTNTYFFYLFAGFIIGLSARFCGRAITWKLQLLCGSINLFLIIIVHLLMDYPIGIFLSIPSVIIASLLAKRSLSEQENLALSQWQSQKHQ